jgi:hypothetical protein
MMTGRGKNARSEEGVPPEFQVGDTQPAQGLIQAKVLTEYGLSRPEDKHQGAEDEAFDDGQVGLVSWFPYIHRRIRLSFRVSAV